MKNKQEGEAKHSEDEQLSSPFPPNLFKILVASAKPGQAFVVYHRPNLPLILHFTMIYCFMLKQCLLCASKTSLRCVISWCLIKVNKNYRSQVWDKHQETLKENTYVSYCGFLYNSTLFKCIIITMVRARIRS